MNENPSSTCSGQANILQKTQNQNLNMQELVHIYSLLVILSGTEGDFLSHPREGGCNTLVGVGSFRTSEREGTTSVADFFWWQVRLDTGAVIPKVLFPSASLCSKKENPPPLRRSPTPNQWYRFVALFFPQKRSNIFCSQRARVLFAFSLSVANTYGRKQGTQLTRDYFTRDQLQLQLTNKAKPNCATGLASYKAILRQLQYDQQYCRLREAFCHTNVSDWGKSQRTE